MNRYLALEGGDGSGKTTVASALADRLGSDGEEVVVVREPGGTALGEVVRGLLLDSGHVDAWAEVMLFAAQRAQLAREVVAPALSRGAWVISDRTYYSSLAYQGHARGLGVDRVRLINETGLDGVVPAWVFVIDFDAGTALGRQHRADRIGGEGVAFQEAVREGYRILARSEPGRVILLDGRSAVEELVDEILTRVRP